MSHISLADALRNPEKFIKAPAALPGSPLRNRSLPVHLIGIPMLDSCAGCGQKFDGTHTKCFSWVLASYRFSMVTLICHVGDDNHILKVHPKIVSGGGVFSHACPGVGLPCFIRWLCSQCFLLPRGLMYPHGLRMRGSPRSDSANATALFCDFSFCNDVGHNSTSDLAKCLGTTPY